MTKEPFTSLSAIEAMVAKALKASLRRRSIDHDADFRDVGLNSNRAMQVLSEIWWTSKIDLPVNVFYMAPTIRKMAAAICDGSALIASDLIRLRDGDDSAPLFLFPGGAGVLLQLDELVKALDWRGTIYGIAFSGLDGIGPIYDRFEREAARSLGIIRTVQKSGPYRLVGYSIGGITALETARLIRRDGEEEIFLGLIDTPQNDHSWPLRVWLVFILRKITMRLSKLRFRRPMRSPRGTAVSPLAKRNINPPRRGTQFEFRFRNPNKPDYPYYSPYWVSHYTPNYTRVGANACRMKGFYTPQRYDGCAFFFASEGGHSLVCDPQAVWPKYLPRTEWIRVPGDHLSMLIGRNAIHLATALAARMRLCLPSDVHR
jgi:thioesterase domain-containing protein/aryl carrier-like protein